MQLQDIIVIPDALGIDDDPPLGDLVCQVTAQAFDRGRSGLNGNDERRAARECGSSEQADIGAAVQNNVAFMHAAGSRPVDSHLLFGQNIRYDSVLGG